MPVEEGCSAGGGLIADRSFPNPDAADQVVDDRPSLVRRHLPAFVVGAEGLEPPTSSL